MSTEQSWLDGAPMDPAAEAVEPQPAVPGYPFMHRGAGAVFSGPTGGGRSSLIQTCAYDASAHGIRTAYLGSEVTAEEFNARAADLASRRGDVVDLELRERLTLVRHLDLMGTLAHAWGHQQEWVEEVAARFDVVAIDPVSAAASALGFDFDKSNADFVRFYDRLVQPLTNKGVAVLLLDNIGHALEARSRAKGASAKQDRADLTFSCKITAQPLGLTIVAGKVRSVRAPFHRGAGWVFDRATQRIELADPEHQADATADAFRPTVLMERVSCAIEADPGLTRRALRTAVKGKHDAKELALELLIAEGYVDRRDGPRYATHHSLRPYRDGGPQAAPDRPPGPQTTTGPLAPTTRGQGPGATTNGHDPAAPNGDHPLNALTADIEALA